MRTFYAQLICLPVLMSAALSAQAAAPEEPVMIEKPLWELGLGGGGVVQPHYPSSSEYQTRGLVLPFVVYRGDILRIGDGGGTRAVAAENANYELSLSLDAAFDAESDNNKLRTAMPDLDFIFEVGPQLIFHLQKFQFNDTSRSELQLALQARAAFSTDFGRIDHHGYVFEPMLRYRHYGFFHPQLEASISLKPLWATRDVHGYFYDVANDYVTADRGAYRAKGGYFGTGLNFSGIWHISDKARMFVGLQTSYYSGASNINSPLFEKKFNTGVGVSLIWSLAESCRKAPQL